MKFDPKNEIEKKFYHLPKTCSCSACNLIKHELKKEVGDKRYNQITKVLNINPNIA